MEKPNAVLRKINGEYRFFPEKDPDMNALDWRWGHPFIPSEKGNKCRGCGKIRRDSTHEDQPGTAEETLERLRPRPTQDEVIAYLESLLPAPQPNAGLREAGFAHDGVWCCEKKSRCKWQAFALHRGLAWGSCDGPQTEWIAAHKRECGGKLIQLLPGSDKGEAEIQKAPDPGSAYWRHRADGPAMEAMKKALAQPDASPSAPPPQGFAGDPTGGSANDISLHGYSDRGPQPDKLTSDLINRSGGHIIPASVPVDITALVDALIEATKNMGDAIIGTPKGHYGRDFVAAKQKVMDAFSALQRERDSAKNLLKQMVWYKTKLEGERDRLREAVAAYLAEYDATMEDGNRSTQALTGLLCDLVKLAAPTNPQGGEPK